MSKGLKTRLLLTVVSAFLWLTQQPADAQLTSTDAWGPLFQARQPYAAPSMPPQVADSVRRWNAIAMSANALDHTPVAPGENRVFGEQLGPGRTSRAFAIVHLAIFDAVNAIAGGYQSYTGLPPAPFRTSMKAAIAQAAHDTLVALFPSQTASFDSQLAQDLSQIWDEGAKTQGIDLGHRAAAAILALRANDGSQYVEPRVGVDFITSSEPGKWRQDPISQIPLALGAYWGSVKPFVLWSADQFRVPPPPALESLAYTTAFYEVKLLGGAGDGNPATIGDPTFTPLGAPASNLHGPNFTPPFPAYPSGHAGFGAALFQILRNFYGTDNIAFTFVSDEFNGMTQDNKGNVRPLAPRSFSSLSEAEEENGQGRIYLGIHWAFDKTEGIAQGRRAGDFVFENALVPVP